MLNPGDPFRQAILRWAATRLGLCAGFLPPPHFSFRESLSLIAGLAERDVIGAVRRHCPEGGLAIDIGANVGYITRRLCMAVGPTGHVHAFEPLPLLLPVTRHNTKRFKNVTLHQMAIAGTSGEAEFFFDPRAHPNSSLYATRLSQSRIRVSARTLDDWLESEGSPQVDFVKIDVEGAEIDVLEGARKVIASNPHVTFVVEYCPANLRAAGRSWRDFFEAATSLGLTTALLSNQSEAAITATGAETIILNENGYRNFLLRPARPRSDRPR